MTARTPAKISTDHPTSRPVSNRTTPITTSATSAAYGTRSQNSRRRFACIAPSCADPLRGYRHDAAGLPKFISSAQLLRSVRPNAWIKRYRRQRILEPPLAGRSITGLLRL